MDNFASAVRHLKNGEAVEDSAQVVVQQFRPRLLAYFRHHNFSEADAEDLVQETFRRVIKGIGGLNDESKFGPWLFQIARNVRLSAIAVAIQRREDALEAIENNEPAAAGSDPDVRIINQDRLERTWLAVEQLPAQQKHCLLLRVVHEMSYDEIAVVLHLSISTVRNHLREARLNLRRILGEAGMKGEPDGTF